MLQVNYQAKYKDIKKWQTVKLDNSYYITDPTWNLAQKKATFVGEASTRIARALGQALTQQNVSLHLREFAGHKLVSGEPAPRHSTQPIN